MIRRALAATAIALGGLAPFAGSPYRIMRDPAPESARGAAPKLAQIDVAQLAASVEREEDHVTALELAEWIRARKPGLRVLDLRSADEFAAYHMPSSERMELQRVVTLPPAADETLVLISDRGPHAAQAWVFLRALGHQHVYFLRRGLDEWLDQVMAPAGATITQSELSRYFGGTPRTDGAAPRATAEASDAYIAQLRRRGC